MTWYRTGTIAVTNGSTTVTGPGTAWVANVIAGYGVLLPDGRLYEIASIVSNTSLTLRTGYLGATATGQSYAVAPLRGPEVRLAQDIAALINDYGAGSDQLQLVTNGVARLLVTTSAATLNVPLGGTAVTQSATDSTAGRLMKVGDHGLGQLNPRAGGVILPDWLSTSQPTGFHHMGNDTDTLNKPAGISGAGFGAAMTVRTSDVMGARIGWRGFRNSAEFFMQKWDADGFGWLLKFFNNRNIVGTVVNASGVPDGAIVERGSNANGQYTRFADGTQICWHRVTASLAIDTGFLGGFRSAAQSWSYAATFSAAPEVVVTPLALTAMSGLTENGPGTTSVNWSVAAVSSQTAANRIVSLFATGRWF